MQALTNNPQPAKPHLRLVGTEQNTNSKEN